MRACKESIYWKTNKEWYCFDYEKDEYILTNKAPERAIKSFELYNNSEDAEEEFTHRDACPF